MRVAALTSGQHTPSSRFRIRQHIDSLSAHGISVSEFIPKTEKSAIISRLPHRGRIRTTPSLYPRYFGLQLAKLSATIPGIVAARRFDATWLSRGLYEGMPSFEWALPSPLFLDVDDAVWTYPPFGEAQMRLTARRSDLVIAGNAFLADWFSAHSRNVEIVPTAVDTDRFFPVKPPDKEEFTIGWIGTRGNFKYLAMISQAIRAVCKAVPGARLLVVAETYPEEINIPAGLVRYVPWNEAEEVKLIQEMDVGIMPLQDDTWCQGKCSFKMLQYMSCGKPVVVSPVGMNRQVLEEGDVGFAATRDDEWVSALIELASSTGVRARLGKNGRQVCEQKYSRIVVADQLATIFRRYV